MGDQSAPWKFYLGDHLDLLGLGTPAKMLGSPNPWNFPQSTALQPCSYWKYDTLHAIVECGSAFFEDIKKREYKFYWTTHTFSIHSDNIDVSFVLSSKGTPVCNSSSSVLVPNRTSPSLLHTFVDDTLPNFPLPFNIPVILTYTSTLRIQAFEHLLVLNRLARKEHFRYFERNMVSL